MKLGSPVAIGSCAALLAGLVVTSHVAPTVGPTAVLFAYGACFLPWVLLLRAQMRGAAGTFLLLAATAVAARLLLVLAEPLLSDDIFRYVWEGRVTWAGLNPFTFAPNAPELAALRDAEIWPRINHPEISTIYPPISQYFFAAVAALGGGVFAMKLGLVAAEAAFVAIAARLLGRGGASRVRSDVAFTAYALNPLVIVEVAWSGHLDVLAWLPLVLGLLIVGTRPATTKWMTTAGALLGFSIAAKFLGLLVLPYLALRRGIRAEVVARSVLLITTVFVVAVSYVGFADAGGKLFRGFGTYAASWSNNAGLFRVFETVSRETLQDGEPQKRIFQFEALDEVALRYGFTKEWEGKTLPNTSFASDQISQSVGKAIALLAVALALLYCTVAVGDPLRAGLVLLLTLYFFAPTVHPWYIAWLAPFAALRWSPAGLVFCAVGVLGYASWWSVAHGGAWSAPWWLVTLEYGVVFAAMVWEVGRRPDDQPASATS